MNLSNISSLVFKVVSITAIAAPSMLAIFIFVNVLINHKNQVRFDDFYIINDLESTGYTQEVLVRHMFDEMQKIRKETANYSTIYTQTDLVSTDESLDIDVAGSGLSLKTVINFIEQFLGFKPNIISGEIIGPRGRHESENKVIDAEVIEVPKLNPDIKKEIKTEPEKEKTNPATDLHRIIIRTTFGRPESFEGNIDEIISYAAKYVLKNIEPLTLGLYLDSLGSYEEMEELIRYVEQTKNDENSLVAGYLLKSYLNYGLNNLKAANKFAKLSLKEKPKDMFALGNMGYLMTQQGLYEEALPIYKKMLEIAPQDYVSIYTNVAEIYLKINKNEDALTYIDKAISVDSSDYVAYLYKSEYLRRKGHLEESIVNINIAKEIFSDIEKDSGFSETYNKLREDIRDKHIKKKNGIN